MNKDVLKKLVDEEIITNVHIGSSIVEGKEEVDYQDLVDYGYVTSAGAQPYVNVPDFSQGGDIKLNNNIIIISPIIIEKDTTIDLNGYSIENHDFFVDETDNSKNCYVFWVKQGRLIIKGLGSVRALGGSEYDMAIWANGGDVEIHGGYFYCKGKGVGDGSDLIYASAGSKVDIYDGEFKCEYVNNVSYAEPQYTILNEKGNGGGTITCYGGKYHKFNPEDNVSENPKKNFCAPGYHVVKNIDIYTVVKD